MSLSTRLPDTRQKRLIAIAFDADGCGYNKTSTEYTVWLCGMYYEKLERTLSRKNQTKLDALTAEIKFKLAELHAMTDAEEKQDELMRGMEHLYVSALLNSPTNHKEVVAKQMGIAVALFADQAPEVLNTIFVMANEVVADQICAAVQDGDLVLIGSGSNRVNKMLDTVGMSQNRTHSIYSDLVYFTQALRERLRNKKVTVCLNPITITDVQEDLAIGENYRAIINGKTEPHYRGVYDDTKLVLLLNYIHNLTNRYSDYEINVWFYDDLIKIINSLH